MTYVIVVAGPIGAGKSAVAARLAVALGAEHRSFGTVVRARALECGLDTDRVTLQELGDSIIASDGWVAFCQAVLGSSATDAVVVDGVRHVGAVNALRSLAGGGPFALVYVDAPRERRLARLLERDPVSAQAFADAEAHPNESELFLVRELADVSVSNTTEDADSVRLVVADLTRKLQRRGFSPRSDSSGGGRDNGSTSRLVDGRRRWRAQAVRQSALVGGIARRYGTIVTLSDLLAYLRAVTARVTRDSSPRCRLP